MRLGEILVEQGKVTRDALEQVLREDRDDALPLGERLVQAGLVTELDVLEALGRQYGMEVATTIADDLLDPSLVQDLPVEWARANCVLPVRAGDGVAALTSNPGQVQVLDDLALLLGREVQPLLATQAGIDSAIERCYFSDERTARDFLQELGAAPDVERAPRAGADDLLRTADDTPVTQLVNLVLLEAVKADASDVHVEPFEDALRVRYRIDGLLYEQASPPKHLQAALVSRLKVMGRLDIAEKRLPQDGMARVRVGEREIDIRISTMPVAEGERVVLRLLRLESAELHLTELGLPGDIYERFTGLLHEPNGIVLVTGPTGSGKTTSLYAALRELDTKRLNLLTIEDPIEYQLPEIGQIQVKPRIGLTFSQGLRHILRQDPDVILVGEIRDLETAEIVVRSSLTGHLVFSTLHTNDALSAVLRLGDMGVPRYLLASALRASMAQRLVRRLCPACRVEAEVPAGERRALGAAGQTLEGASVWRAEGCPQCLGGYAGRTGIYELVVSGPALQQAIHSGADTEALTRIVREEGAPTLADDGVAKVKDGITSVDEVLRVIGRMDA